MRASNQGAKATFSNTFPRLLQPIIIIDRTEPLFACEKNRLGVLLIETGLINISSTKWTNIPTKANWRGI